MIEKVIEVCFQKKIFYIYVINKITSVVFDFTTKGEYPGWDGTDRRVP
jgi:hypothetical protein